MQDFKDAGLWDLAYHLNPTDKELCSNIDPYLADKLNGIDSLLSIYYYLCYGDVHKMLPKTKNRINELFRSEMESGRTIPNSQFRNFSAWIDSDLKSKVIEDWLTNDSMDIDDAWMMSSLPNDPEINFRVLVKLTRMYKKKKSLSNVKIIERIFSGLDKDKLAEACELLSKSTPAVAAVLLRRSDIPEEYTIKGLKAISKLSKQRDIGIEIDFEMLKHLGPRGRLDAMKQLMGMFDKYYKMRKVIDNIYFPYSRYSKHRQKFEEFKLPFKSIPNQEDIEKFLFPCSLKYNDEVVAMVARFKELSSHKEVNNGKSV